MEENMSIENLYDLLTHELKDLLSADHQLVKELPLLLKAASSENLKKTLRDQIDQTKIQIKRLEKALEELSESNIKEQCEGMEGILFETHELLKTKEKSSVQDAAIIANLQKALCYEISGYGSAKTFAYDLQLHEIADLLEDTLKEKAKEDRQLTKVAQGSFFSKGINQQASQNLHHEFGPKTAVKTPLKRKSKGARSQK